MKTDDIPSRRAQGDTAVIPRIEPDAIYLPKEVAELLRCSLRNVYSLINSKRLTAVSVGAGGKAFRISGSSILEFVARPATGETAPVMEIRNPRLRAALGLK